MASPPPTPACPRATADTRSPASHRSTPREAATGRHDQRNRDFRGGLVRIGRQSESCTRSVANFQTPPHILQSHAGSRRFCDGLVTAVLHDDAKLLAAQFYPHMNIARLRALRGEE